MRKIDDILKFRKDISPFLIHMTKDAGQIPAKNILKNSILSDKRLKAGDGLISSANYTTNKKAMNKEQKKRYFSSICFTEAPLDELHFFFDIENRQVNYSPYGLVFMKEKLLRKGVSPVFYVNNYQNDKSTILKEFCDCIIANKSASEEILPLITSMGHPIAPPSGNVGLSGEFSFYWEREWRFPYAKGDLTIDLQDLFLGLCPHQEIDEFECYSRKIFGDILYFVDPHRNIKYYSNKLLKIRDKLNSYQIV